MSRSYDKLIEQSMKVSLHIQIMSANVIGPYIEAKINNATLWRGCRNSSIQLSSVVPLLQPVTIDFLVVDIADNDSVILNRAVVDDYDLTDNDVMFYNHSQCKTWQYRSEIPFYQWKHNHTGQGWLLKPQR